MAGVATPARAQESAPRWRAATVRPGGGAVTACHSLAPTSPDASDVPLHQRPWIRPIASLLVPGTGQLLAGQGRGMVYLAAEAWLVARAIGLAREGRRQRGLFQTLAFDVARRQFTSVRVDGPFTYYETMSEFVESGVYDADPGPGFEPESDPGTFNGSVWQLARETFFANPDSIPDPSSASYQAALAFYRSRAVTPEFRWSWRNRRLEQDVFRAAIRASDEAFRSATNYLGGVVVNHIASAVDALVATRLGRRGTVPRLDFDPWSQSWAVAWRASF